MQETEEKRQRLGRSRNEAENVWPVSFPLPLLSHPLPLGMLGTEVPAESPILHVAASFSLELWCQCLAEQVWSRGLPATIHHTCQGQKGAQGMLWKKQSYFIYIFLFSLHAHKLANQKR